MTRGSHALKPAWSYVAANASQPVLEQTLGDALRLAGKTWPSKPALIQGALETGERRKWTFQDLIEQSEQVARALLSRFEPGDHVAIWMANQSEWLLVEFGAALAGLTLVAVNPAFLDEELIFVLKQSKARGIVVQDAFRDRNLVSVIERVRGDAPSLETIIPLSTWSDFLRSGATDLLLPDVYPNDVAQKQKGSNYAWLP
jgi:fatty-acyl-CoA synthase